MPPVKSLYEVIPKGTEGGKEFARIVDLLIFHDSRRSGKRAFLFDDSAGDFRGLDSFSDGPFRKAGGTSIGYQYKFFPSPFSSAHRKSIEESLLIVAKNQSSLKLKRWVLVTPQNLIESSSKAGGGDVTWFENLRKEHNLAFEVDHWGHTKLLGMFLETPALALFYYPELVDVDNSRRRTIADIRERYDTNLLALYRDIQFVGMSVYKQEATRGVAIQEIYIPLTIVPEESDPGDSVSRRDPLELLERGSNHVVLGDPGSGKSTLLRFLALSGTSKALQDRYHAKADNRLPIIVVLRKYADELKATADLALFDYIIQNIQADLSLKSADLGFFEYYLESGQAELFFDGLDELPSPHFKEVVRDRIKTFLLTYPGNTAIITSRIVGYDAPFRFDEAHFRHFRISNLQLAEIEQFVRDWYRVRIENRAERERNVDDLLRILRDDDHIAIRQLAQNPLLLTIVTLVHRIDAVLPDERVVLYQKCTETLLNTWHTWKFRETEQKNRGKIERRNRARMESIAHWMQCLSVGSVKSSRAVVSYSSLHAFLTKFISSSEPSTSEMDPEDSATEFIEFVRKRAGLMIEAGDEQFSFVHLTFQEYLTATYLVTSNEVSGAAGIWKTIESYCRDVRWHEVIRLLVGGLRSSASQAFLLTHLLDAVKTGQPNLAELVGGLVLDGIEPAEERLQEILQHLLVNASLGETQVSCQRLLRVVRAWKRKESYDQHVLESALQQSLDQGSITRPVAILMAVACDVGIDWLADHISQLSTKDRSTYFLSLFFAPTLRINAPTELGEDFDRLFEYVALCLVTSHEANLAAARMQGIFWCAGYPIAARYCFQLMMSSLIGGVEGGPFYEFTSNTIRLNDERGTLPLPPKRSGITLSETTGRLLITRKQPHVGRDRLERALYRLAHGKDLDEEQGQGGGLPQDWNGRDELDKRVQRSEYGRNLPKKIRSLNLVNRAPTRKKGSDIDVFQFAASYEIGAFCAELVSKALILQPQAQWESALSSGFLPNIPTNVWPGRTSHFSIDPSNAGQELANEDCFYLAWHILFRCWSDLFEYPGQALPSEWLEFAASSRHPAIRIAVAVRALSLAETNDPDILVNLSKEPICAELLRKCGLLPEVARRRRTSGAKRKKS